MAGTSTIHVHIYCVACLWRQEKRSCAQWLCSFVYCLLVETGVELEDYVLLQTIRMYQSDLAPYCIGNRLQQIARSQTSFKSVTSRA